MSQESRVDLTTCRTCLKTHMIKDSIECGHTIFFHVRVVSGQKGISYGKLYFLKKEYKEAIKSYASKSQIVVSKTTCKLEALQGDSAA